MATAAKKAPPKKGNTGKTVAGVKIAKKKVTVRRAHLADEKYTGGEPVWDTERALTFSDADFDHHMRRSFYYYNYHFTVKDLKPDLIKWLQEQTHFEVTKNDLAKIIKSRWVPITACSLIAAHGKGMPLKPRAIQYIETAMREVAEKYGEYNEEDDQPAEEVKPVYKAPTIQDRLNEKTAETIGELEGHYDEFCLNPKYQFGCYNFLVANNVPQSQLSKYEDLYSARKTELQTAQAGKDEQLKEGYSHYKAADFKRMIAFIDAILSDVEQYRGVKKATKKVRAPRAVSKEKVVSKLKYAKESKELKMVSINPVDILNSQELWVYNTKTRKLGKYVADSLRGPLSVKGTTITGYDEVKSVSKTLRKPEEKLKEFGKAGKIQLRKFLEDIKATETRLNGRIGADVLLLRVA